MFDLTNKIALVTGATGGIGRSIIKDFITSGAKVVAVGRNQEKLKELNNEFGDKVSTLICDFNDKSHVISLFENAEKEYGNIDILVCNAGITKDNLALRLKDEDWDDVIEMNLNSTFKLNRSAIKSMMKRRYGRIINISSVIGLSGNAGQANYAASKAGIIAMSKSLAKEVAARGITINCVAPGYIDTPMTQVLNDDIKNSIILHIPAKRIGVPKDVSSAVIFLASNESSYINGHTLSVNGGMLMS
ncbi:3-oxoacyl-[acyl-carrier-protein] reductase [Rickettsiales endosymbiont of Trichoplax sp. H2]|uniref:3-oxoacyl-[acyl-carrier-protein] reductase n=1 Tax=Rickettsiales endosymbiont of Trichoplax sp. H2 TaxID=2021221 RepID=UPI0012B24E6F|nr:3-oxoacyl-[acyl-carrier-protein] reductase [Rickettsiales endosymbiont of Trichoplax sp. H2]MSO14217.1 3-oxoacyl-[acyl-carrier-protein] reductase FabG [Rickettsiales endosymbiont of Trichoplax sp. H2]